MAEELQGLLDRIREEGLDRAESEANAVLEEARQKAKAHREQAEAEAQEIVARAKEEAQTFEQRSISAVKQAARDVVLSVSDAVERLFAGMLQKAAADAMSGPEFQTLLRDVILAYSKSDDAPQLDVLLNEKQKQDVVDFLLTELSGQMKNGLKVEGSRNIVSGFSVVLRDEGIEHDFTDKTLIDAFLAILRPELGAIVKQAMNPKDADSDQT